MRILLIELIRPSVAEQGHFPSSEISPGINTSLHSQIRVRVIKTCLS